MYSNHPGNKDQYRYNPNAHPIENAINNMHFQWPMPALMEAPLRACMKVIRIRKGDRILMPDMQVNKFYFLNKGLMKFYSHGPKSKNTIDFWNYGEYVLMYKEFMDGGCNKEFYIEALEDCELVLIGKEDFRPVMTMFLETHIIVEKIGHLKARRRVNHMQILMLPAKERYRALDAKESMYREMRLKQRLPDQEMAEFLSVSLRTLYDAKNLV